MGKHWIKSVVALVLLVLMPVMVHAAVSADCDVSGGSVDVGSDLDEAIIYAYECIADNSNIATSQLNSTVVIDSTLTSVTAVDTYIDNSVMADIDANFSTIEDTSFSCGNMTISGTVDNGILSNGKIIKGDLVYFSPFDVSAICSGVLPISGIHTATPPIMRNGTEIIFNFVGVASGYDVSALVDVMNDSASSWLQFFDDGSWVDESANDGIYSALLINRNTTNETAIISAYVNDTVGNYIPFNTTVTFDNENPNATLTINDGGNETSSRSVELSISTYDLNGVSGCRYSNYDLASIIFRAGFESTYTSEQGTPKEHPLPRNFTTGVSGQGFSVESDVQQNLTYKGEDILLLGEGTISYWFKDASGSTSGDDNHFIANNSANEYFKIYEEFGTNILSMVWTDGTGITQLNYSFTPNNDWNHVAVTFDNIADGSHEATLYYNGQIVNSTTSGTDFPTVAFEEIILKDGTQSHWKVIDEFMITNYTKGSDEVYEDYTQPTKYTFGSCPSTTSWLLLNSTGNKTVYLQVEDVAGNVQSAQDSIALTLFGDITAPTDLVIRDDGDYTSETTQLRGRWDAFDQESTVFFRYRLWNETAALTSWITAPDFGRSTEDILTGLSLSHNSTYRFEVSAENYNALSITGFSDGITIDTESPETPFLNSTTHPQATWTGSDKITISMNSSDNLSGVIGYSYVLDQVANTDADEVSEVSFDGQQTYWNWTDNPSAQAEEFHSVATDSAGNIYAAGLIYEGGASDSSFYVGKFNATGGQEWNYTYNFSDGVEELYGIAVDSSNNIIAAGYDSENSFAQFHALKLNKTGSLLWNYTYEVSGGHDQLQAVVTDSNNAIYLAGYDSDGGDNQVHILKLDSSGSFVWNYTFDHSAGSEIAYDIDLMSNGNIVFAGRTQEPGNSAFYISVLNTTGEHLWNWTDNPSGANDNLYGVAVDLNDNVIAVGSDDTQGDAQHHLIKLNSAGTVLWNLTTNPSSGDEFLYGVDTDSNNDIVVAGFNAEPGNGQHQLVKRDENGNFRWNTTINPSGSGDLFNAVTIDGSDNVVAAGRDRAAGDDQLSLYRLSPQGDFIYHAEYTLSYFSVADGVYWFHSRARDDAGNWGLTGHYQIYLDDTAPSTPQFTSFDSVQNAINLSLAWTESTDAVSGVIGYHLRIDNDTDFSSPEFEEFVSNVTSKTVQMSSNGTWYASVRAENGATLNSTWSSQITKVIDQIAPTITITNPSVDGETTVDTQPLFIASTDEPATCTYTILGNPTEYTVGYTGTFYHENKHPFVLANGAQSVTFQCSDAVGNTNTTTRTFTVNDALTANAVAWVGVSPAYAGVVTNGTINVQDSGATNLAGLEPDLFTVYVDGDVQEDAGINDLGGGNYEILFRPPELPGIYNLIVKVGPATSPAYSLTASELKLYIQINGNIGSLSKRSYMVYGESDTGIIGLATDTDNSQSNLTTSPLRIGSRISDDAYIFIAGTNAEPDKKDNFLSQKTLLDQPVPAFSSKNEPDEYTTVTTLEYASIVFPRSQEVKRGNYQLSLKYNGIYQTGPNAGKINMSAELT